MVSLSVLLLVSVALVGAQQTQEATKRKTDKRGVFGVGLEYDGYDPFASPYSAPYGPYGVVPLPKVSYSPYGYVNPFSPALGVSKVGYPAATPFGYYNAGRVIGYNGYPVANIPANAYGYGAYAY